MKRPFHKWTPEEETFLKENFQQYTRQELADQLGVNLNSIKSKARILRLKKDKEALSTIYKRPNAGQFRKGEEPLNSLHDKAITLRIDTRGQLYKWIRLSKNKWQMLHVYLWEKAGNETPHGFVVRFKDKNPLNCVLQNLELMPRSTHLSKNREEYLKSKERAPRKERKIIIRKKIKQAKKTSKKLRVKIEKPRKIKIERRENRVKETSTYKNRNIDLSQLISVRVDRKTVIFVKPGTDIEKIKRQYA